jgi:Histidine ammonia-lyase
MVVRLGGEVKLSISDVVRVARLNEEVALSEEALGLMMDSRAVLEGLVAKGISMYGVNTGLGELYNVTVGADEVASKSIELLMDHAAGVGDYAPDDWVRGTMAVRAHQLSRGFSGVREVVVDTLIQLLNRGWCPLCLGLVQWGLVVTLRR